MSNLTKKNNNNNKKSQGIKCYRFRESTQAEVENLIDLSFNLLRNTERFQIKKNSEYERYLQS